MAIKGVIFDMDGVIIESHDVWSNGLLDVLNANGYVDVTLSQLNLPSMSGMSLEYGSLVFKTCCLESGIHINQSVEELTTMRREFAYKYYLEEVRLIEGFSEFILMLQEMDIKVCVGTAADPALLQALELNQGVRIFSTFGEENVHCIGDVGFKSKPDPAIFLHCADRLKLVADECVVIEDSPLGVRAASNGGFRCLGFRSRYADEVLLQEGAMCVSNGYEELRANFLQLMQEGNEIVEQSPNIEVTQSD